MTRILYWNIQNFSLPKIDTSLPWPDGAYARERRNLIVNTVRGPAAGLVDIIVVVEVYNRSIDVELEGTVFNSDWNSGQACLQILRRLRSALGNNWCLVPPLTLGNFGQSEGVAVYYNSNSVMFAGPDVYYRRYPGDNIGQAQPLNAATFHDIVDYPDNWKNCMRNPANPIPALSHGRNYTETVAGIAYTVNEWQSAGHWEFYNGPHVIPSPLIGQPNRIKFPYTNCRGPFWTRFIEVVGGRVLNIFAVHTSPSSAPLAMERMSDVSQMTTVNPDEVNIIVGDFNVDSFTDFASYDWLIGQYRMGLDPRNPPGGAGAPVPARKPYCLTHLLPTDQAGPFNNTGGMTGSLHNVYPRFGYMGSLLTDTGAIDNVFVAYGAHMHDHFANMTVVNQIVGSPYNAYPVPPPPAPPPPPPFPAGVTHELTAGVVYPSILRNHIPMGLYPGGVGPAPGGGYVDPIDFQAWPNFGRIRSASDHLPLLFDV